MTKKENANTKEKSKKKEKLLSPKLDVVFQVLFGEKGSENITKNFLRLARARAPGTVVFGAVVSGTVVSCVVGLGSLFCFVCFKNRVEILY